MFYYVYVLQSLNCNNKSYTDYTENLKLRFEEQRKGRVASTKNRRPLRLIYYEAGLNRKDAMHREKYFKTYLGKMFLKKRLKSYLTGCSVL